MSGSNSPLGLFGGRFDPVHRAHIKIAQAVADQLKLDEVRWIVTGSPVHKPTVASAYHRLRMVELALAELGDQRMVADDREVIEAAAGKTNYSADTIASLQAEFPGRPLVWILGADQLEQFRTWSRWDWILNQVSIAVYARQDHKTSANFDYKINAQIYEIKSLNFPISSSWIRERLKAGETLGNATTLSVQNYIIKHHLYLK